MKFVITDVYMRILCLYYLMLYTDGQACSWPAEIEGTWIDSLKGEVTFSSDGTMTGWDIEADGDFGGSNMFREVWECVNVDNFTTDGYVVMKTTDTITQFFMDVYVYRCMQLTKITDYSFRYYQREAVHPTIAYDRVKVLPVLSGEVTDTSVICDHDNGASRWEYQVMIASGNEASAKVPCPYSFVGLYDYTHETFSSTTCETDGDTWDMCSDNTQVTFDYNTCSTQVAYSVADTVWCVDNVPVGTSNFAMLYNHLDATTDETTTFRFSCLAVNAENTEGSISPQHCKHEQTPTGLPIANDGSVFGAKLTFTQTANYCPPCPVLSNPSEGAVVVYTEGVVTLANYTCYPGNSISGSSIRTCLESGAWDPPEHPTCTCATPADPTNGAAHMQFGVNVTTVNYTCDAGYVLVGNHERTCLTDTNSWTGTNPICDACDALTTPDSGTLTIVSIGVTSLASFTCDVRFSMDGVPNTFCLTDGSWNSTVPSCTVCQSLSTLFSGSILYSTSGTVTTAYHTCAAGYTLVGLNPLNCLSNSVWDNSQPICVCNDPAVPDNGTMIVSNSNTTATYKCDLYFTMDGSNTRTCLADGTGWDGVDPICVSCGALTTPLRGAVVTETDGTTTTATYTCSSGYDVFGVAVSECLTDGAWTSVAPTCVCTPPVTPSNGNAVLSADNMTISYTCDSGYSLSGSKTITCQTDGSGWDVVEPSCALCEAIQEPNDGSMILASDGSVTTATFDCDPGATMNGTQILICIADGTWDGDAPTCVACTALSDPQSGNFTYTDTATVSIVEFACADGYDLIGATTSTCQLDGTWDNVSPTCLCTEPAVPSNGNMAVSDGGYKLTYTCATGYTLDGAVNRTCQTDGSGWDFPEPSCVSCGSLSLPFGATTQEYTTGTETRVLVSCEVGYSMNGTALLSCTSEGSWDNPVPDCVQCIGALIETASLTLESNTDGVTTSVLYTCAKGYSMNGDRQRNCLSDGSYDIVAPTCVECALLANISSGTVNITTDGQTSTARYTCATGGTHDYYLDVDSPRTCLIDGSWTGVEPTCYVDECASISGLCGAFGNCTNTNGSYICTCQDGFSSLTPTDVCIDVDECTTTPDVCGANAQCTNYYGSFHCHCDPAFSGDPPNTPCTEFQTPCAAVCPRSDALLSLTVSLAITWMMSHV